MHAATLDPRGSTLEPLTSPPWVRFAPALLRGTPWNTSERGGTRRNTGRASSIEHRASSIEHRASRIEDSSWQLAPGHWQLPAETFGQSGEFWGIPGTAKTA